MKKYDPSDLPRGLIGAQRGDAKEFCLDCIKGGKIDLDAEDTVTILETDSWYHMGVCDGCEALIQKSR